MPVTWTVPQRITQLGGTASHDDIQRHIAEHPTTTTPHSAHDELSHITTAATPPYPQPAGVGAGESRTP